MQKTKRQRTNTSLLEDLSNEILYEIFEYLDNYHVYEGFLDLNKRFQNILFNSTLPIKINISTISKSSFEHYHKNMIIPNKHRINILRLSNPFTVDIVFSPPRIISKFVRLEILVLDDIHAKYLNNILNHLTLLSELHSLVLNPADCIQHPNILFRHIFRLPKLKNCKITYQAKYDLVPLTVSVNEYQLSPIEHLVINSRIRFDSFYYLIYCLPQLRYLSIDCLVESDCEDIELYPIRLLTGLKYVSLKLNLISFDRFRYLALYFFRYVKVLRISTSIDPAYLDAEQWEELILAYMPNLRIFDINHEGGAEGTESTYHDLIDQFTSSFWIERQWFFTHQHQGEERFDGGIFYSTNPYRRKDYQFYWKMDHQACDHIPETNLNFVKHVQISNQLETYYSAHYFPNATELTIKYYFEIPTHLIKTILNDVLPLEHITKLVYECCHWSSERFIELLICTPNLHTLKCAFMNLYETNRKNDSFQYVSNTNKIKNLDVGGWCTLEEVQCFVSLFPQVEYLKMGVFRKEMVQIIQYLLSQIDHKTRHLVFLCISNLPKICLRELNILIKREKLLDDYFIKYVNHDLYLWW